jgi:deoxyribonuclease V
LVRPKISHPWPDNYRDAVALQESLRGRLVTETVSRDIRLIAGADVSYSKGSDWIYSAVVLMSFPGLDVVEESWAVGKATYPYVPGTLSFREGPVTLEAFAGLKKRPDLLIFDGQGMAHPRGFGLACHMGLLMGIPSIGVAKSVLVGEYDEPGEMRGSASPMIYKGREVGRALRTRDNVNPVFVSIGHMVDLDFACRVVLLCGRGYRVPEPTRRAHLLVNKIRAEDKITRNEKT